MTSQLFCFGRRFRLCNPETPLCPHSPGARARSDPEIFFTTTLYKVPIKRSQSRPSLTWIHVVKIKLYSNVLTYSSIQKEPHFEKKPQNFSKLPSNQIMEPNLQPQNSTHGNSHDFQTMVFNRNTADHGTKLHNCIDMP